MFYLYATGYFISTFVYLTLCILFFCRWLISLIEDKAIPRLPMEVTDWLVIDGPESMYPLEWKENAISAWERKKCPWWLDYPQGIVPPSEKDIYEQRLALQQGKRAIVEPVTQGSASKRHASRVRASGELRTKRAMDYIEDVQEPQHSEVTPVDDNTEDYIATSPGKIVVNPFILFFHKNNERCHDNLNSLCIDRTEIRDERRDVCC